MNLPTKEMPCRAIWIRGGGADDEYADFFPEVSFRQGHRYTVRIAADTDYNIFLDGKLAGFGQFSDTPDRLIYDEYELSPREGSKLKLTFWHSGIDALTHMKHTASAAFALFEDGIPVPGGCSGPDTRSSLCPSYAQHRRRIITGQLGPGFGCVSPRLAALPSPAPSEVADISYSAVLPRPNRKLVTEEPIAGKLIRSGRFAADAAEAADPCLLMTHAKLTDFTEGDRPAASQGSEQECVSLNGGDLPETEAKQPLTGSFFLFDAGTETVGFPELRFRNPEASSVFAGWGEHITDGICRTVIGSRRFGFDCLAAPGDNLFFPALRRIGCRYFQFFITGEPEEVEFFFHPVVYPVAELPSGIDISTETGRLREKIRSTAVRTLRCCMHEHYEDCPWREQSLYTLDSRNQMLAGYRVFEGGNREMARASLDLMSRGIRPDGIMKLCYPGGVDRPIPFYSLAWFVQFDEYLAFTGDTAFAAEKMSVLTGLAASILSRAAREGSHAFLCPRYPESRGIWNFYEWSPSMSGGACGADEKDPPFEAPFNAFLAVALRSLADMCERTASAEDTGLLKSRELSERAEAYRNIADRVTEAVRRVFFDPSSGLFRSFTDRPGAPFSVLTQALCVLSGAADGLSEGTRERLEEVILKNGSGGAEAVPATLSMACFRYDALLGLGGRKFAPAILEEIDRDGKYMLDRGATTFWETIRGEADFAGAGSLCHGWSAMSAYYYSLLL